MLGRARRLLPMVAPDGGGSGGPAARSTCAGAHVRSRAARWSAAGRRPISSAPVKPLPAMAPTRIHFAAEAQAVRAPASARRAAEDHREHRLNRAKRWRARRRTAPRPRRRHAGWASPHADSSSRCSKAVSAGDGRSNDISRDLLAPPAWRASVSRRRRTPRAPAAAASWRCPRGSPRSPRFAAPPAPPARAGPARHAQVERQRGQRLVEERARLLVRQLLVGARPRVGQRSGTSASAASGIAAAWLPHLLRGDAQGDAVEKSRFAPPLDVAEAARRHPEDLLRGVVELGLAHAEATEEPPDRRIVRVEQRAQPRGLALRTRADVAQGFAHRCHRG